MFYHFQKSPLTVVRLFLVLLAVSTQAAAQTPVFENSLPGYTIPHARDLVVDQAGNSFLLGSAYDDGTHLDVLVAKFFPSGDHAWTRYITTGDHCYATGIALDSAGDAWVTGWTDSPDFPVLDAMDSTLTGFRDVFLMKLDALDGAIIYSTYLGGDYSDAAQDIFLNEADEIYLTGSTGSTDFPVTSDAWQSTPSFPEYFYKDAFITKLNAAGDTILYSTYFGGLHDDRALEISLDSENNILIAGTTEAEDFPLVNPIQSMADDLFIAKLSPDGGSLLFSTYFGGEDLDQLGQMVLDDAGLVYLVGTTRSVAFPTTSGVFQENFAGEINGCEVPFGADYNCEDIFVTKLSTEGDGILWSTYLGGNRVEVGRAIAVDHTGGVYVSGYTGSADFPPYGMDFGAEIIVCRLNATGSVLDFTYSIDSGSANRGNGIFVDENDDVYFSGTVGVPASIYISKLSVVHQSAVGEKPQQALLLHSNYPNPFNPRTNISFELAEPLNVRLQVYDLEGKMVRRWLADDYLAPGSYEFPWFGRDDSGRKVASGVYLYRLDAGPFSETKPMVLIK